MSSFCFHTSVFLYTNFFVSSFLLPKYFFSFSSNSEPTFVQWTRLISQHTRSRYRIYDSTPNRIIKQIVDRQHSTNLMYILWLFLNNIANQHICATTVVTTQYQNACCPKCFSYIPFCEGTDINISGSWGLYSPPQCWEPGIYTNYSIAVQDSKQCEPNDTSLSQPQWMCTQVKNFPTTTWIYT